MKWWRKETPKRPAVDLPVKNAAGDVIGRIIINPDGVFVGNIDSVAFQKTLAAAVEYGFSSSVTLAANLNQPPPSWEKNK